MKPKVTESNYETCLRRLGEVQEQILEINTLLAEGDTSAWILGDPNETLSSLEIERDELQMMVNDFVKVEFVLGGSLS